MARFAHIYARIKCNDYPDAYLCNANGSYVNNNKVYAWPKQVCILIPM